VVSNHRREVEKCRKWRRGENALHVSTWRSGESGDVEKQTLGFLHIPARKKKKKIFFFLLSSLAGREV